MPLRELADKIVGGDTSPTGFGRFLQIFDELVVVRVIHLAHVETALQREPAHRLFSGNV
jgi:hypothetical protein